MLELVSKAHVRILQGAVLANKFYSHLILMDVDLNYIYSFLIISRILEAFSFFRFSHDQKLFTESI